MFDTAFPEIPSLERILDITAQHVEDRVRREAAARAARDYYEDNKISILSARLLSELVPMIEEAAADGRTEFVAQLLAEGTVSIADGRAVAKTVRDALRAFSPEIRFVVHDKPSPYYWEAKFDWAADLEKRLRG